LSSLQTRGVLLFVVLTPSFSTSSPTASQLSAHSVWLPSSSAPPAATASTLSSAAQAQSRVSRRAAGAVSLARGIPRWSASMPVQPLCRGPRRLAGPVPFALVALAVALSVVSLYYYLQVLKRAYVMPLSMSLPSRPIRSRWRSCGDCYGVVVLGCFPALLQNWIESCYR